MTLRTGKHLLLAASVTLALGLMALVIGFVAWPVEDDPGMEEALPTAEAPPPRETRPPAYYAVIYQRNLLRPIFDTETAQGKKAAPKLEVTLEGTAIEPGFTYGLFRTKDGKVKFVSVGQTIEGAEVLALASGQATLRYHDQEITLQVNRDKGGKP